jgi:hypothetical protein
MAILCRARAESLFRAHVLTTHRSDMTVIGRLIGRVWSQVRIGLRAAFAI